MTLRGHACCLIDEATKTVLRVSSEPLTAPDGCTVRSVLAEQLPPEVQALSSTPTNFDIEAVFIGAGRAAYLADDTKSVRIEVRESDDGVAESRHAEMLARRFETMEPTGLVEAALVGLIRLAGADTVAKAALATPLETPPSSEAASEPPKAKRKPRRKVK